MITIALLTGVVTGILSGLLGIGGGAVLVASSVFFLGINQHMAQAAAIAAIIPTALVGVYMHHRRGLIDYHTALLLALGSLVGGACGSYVANILPETVLRRVFSIFFAIMSIQMFWASFRQSDKKDDRNAGQ